MFFSIRAFLLLFIISCTLLCPLSYSHAPTKDIPSALKTTKIEIAHPDSPDTKLKKEPVPENIAAPSFPDNDINLIPSCTTETAKKSSLNWREIAKDLALACGVAYFLTLIHELGHAFTAKLLLNQPINVVIGSHTKDTIYAQVPGIALGGFNPLNGATFINTQAHPLHAAAFAVSGPLSGALAGYIIFKKTPCDLNNPPFSKEDKFYFTKITSLLLIVGHLLNLIPLRLDGFTHGRG